MKGLAIYSLVMLAIAELSMVAEVIMGIDVAINVMAIGMWIPVLIFLIMYLKGGKN